MQLHSMPFKFTKMIALFRQKGVEKARQTFVDTIEKAKYKRRESKECICQNNVISRHWKLVNFILSIRKQTPKVTRQFFFFGLLIRQSTKCP
jgi:hypothetical protein